MTLDLEKHQLEGWQIIRYRNLTASPMEDLQLHLYLNAFKNLKSTFMRESGGQLRGDRYKKAGWGAIDILEMTTADGLDVKPSIEFVRPDDGNEDDETVIQVELSAAIPPGEAIDLQVHFEARLPKVFARTGYRGSFHMVGQWFPKMGVFEERSGQPAAWNCHQFHAASEFFSDYGVYDVRIATAADAVVGATGELVEAAPGGAGQQVHHYRAEDVHDFAFTVDRDFREAKERWREVEIRLLYQPEHEPLVGRHMEAARTALEFFDGAYGPYPYKTLTLVDPGPGAGGARGMEYPTLITVGASYYTVPDRLLPWLIRDRGLELTLIHEFGHQYWYGLVGSNEFEEAWLDEGFNSYSESKAVREPVAELLGGRMVLSDIGLHRVAYAGFPHEGAILEKSWRYPSLVGYGVGSYSKPAVVLRTLENLLGEEVMGRVVRTYAERFRFKHPRSEDFFAVAAEVSGQDLAAYWDQFVRRDLSVDFAVRSVSSKREKELAGLYDVEGKRIERTPEDLRKAAKDKGGKEEGEKLYRTVVMLDRRAEGILPVDWEVLFADGHVEKGTWDGKDRARRLEWVRNAKGTRAMVDPERKLLLDVSFANNGRYASAGGAEVFSALMAGEPPEHADREGDEKAAGRDDLKASRGAVKRLVEAAAASAAALAQILSLWL